MKWLTTSTGSPREVANRFASEAFEEPREVDHQSWSLSLVTANDANGTVRGLFRLKGGRQVYEIEGVPPGRWTITSKILMPHKEPRKV